MMIDHSNTNRGAGGRVIRCSRLLVVTLPLVLSLAHVCQAQAPSNGQTVTPASMERDSGPEWMAIVKARGFIGEAYKVPTPDGTQLSMYHIINPFADPRTLYRQPVLVFHGIIGDAAQMIGHTLNQRARRPVIGEITYDAGDTGLPLLLANNNFDVFMVDARGTNMNNRNISVDMNPFRAQHFWNFSLDEQSLNDLPSAVEFVLEQTHEEKLHYIGFSQSTIFMFCLLSQRPAFAAKLASYIAVAPVSYIDHISGITVGQMAPTTLLPDNINGNFVPQQYIDTIGVGLKQLCQLEFVARTLCISVTSSFAGAGPNEASHGFLATTFKSTSIKVVKHLMQWYTRHRLAMYDYGPKGNLRQYGQPTAPVYNLTNIRFPYIVLFRGDKDLLSDTHDQQRLLRELGTKPYLDFHYPHYNHLDFLMSKNIIQEINLPAARTMLSLLKLQSAGLPFGILRDPAKLALPRRLKPVSVVFPNGDRRVEIKSSLANHLIEGMIQEMEDPLLNKATGGGSPVVKQLVAPSLNMLRGLDNQVQSMNSQFSRVADLVGLGSIAPPVE